MFRTTIRLTDEAGNWLQDAASQSAQSVNAFLEDLIEQARQEAARRRLAEDWAAYAQDTEAQDVSYALGAQAEVVAEPPGASRGSR